MSKCHGRPSIVDALPECGKSICPAISPVKAFSALFSAQWRTMAHDPACSCTFNSPHHISSAKTCAITTGVRNKQQNKLGDCQFAPKQRQHFFGKNNGGSWRVLADCGGYWRNEPVTFKPNRTLPSKHAL